MWANTPINKQLSQWSSHNVSEHLQEPTNLSLDGVPFRLWPSFPCFILNAIIFLGCLGSFSETYPFHFKRPYTSSFALSLQIQFNRPSNFFYFTQFFFFLLIWYFINSNKETWTWQKLFFLWNHHDQNSPQFGSWFDVCLSLAVKDVITTTAGSKQKSKCGCGNAYSVCCSQLSCSNGRCFFGHRSGRCAGICKVCVWFILN